MSPLDAPRPEDLPELASPYDLAPAQREVFHRDGHVLLPGLMTPAEVAAYRPPLGRVVDRVYGALNPRERTLYTVPALWTVDDAARRFVLARRFAGVAAGLLGVPAVRLWRDVAFFKAPRSEITPWHQDAYWEPLDGHTLLLLWVALTDVTPEMGPLTFVTGSHRRGCVGITHHDDPSQAAGRVDAEARGQAVTHHAPMRAGDATAHYGWTLHSAPRNVSATRREAISIIYFPDGVRISVPERPACSADEEAAWREVHRYHMTQRFPGLAVGDLARSERCPVLPT